MAKRTEFQIDVDDALTKRLNREQSVAGFLAACTVHLRRQFEGDTRVFFYLKGSAALRRYLLAAGVPQDRIDAVSAPSDWDTQLVIDPGLPPAEWFKVFRTVLETISNSLIAFEKELPRTLDAVFGGGGSADALRARIAGVFGQELAQLGTDQKFRTGAQNARIPWAAIERLRDTGKPEAILDLNIQGHNRAVLTTPFVHPAQPLANLNAIWAGEQSAELAGERRKAAEEAWTRIDAVTERYNEVWTGLIQRPEVVEELARRLTGADASRLEAAFLSDLPPRVVEQLIDNLGDGDRKVRIQLWAGVHEVWGRRLASGETASAQETQLARLLADGYARSPEASAAAAAWLAQALPQYADVLRAVADHYLPLAGLPQQLQMELEGAWAAVEAVLAEYEEAGDPEEEAEAVKRDTEALAPFALVNLENGSLKTASVLENMTIPDFYLFRLMIRAQLSNAPENRVMPTPSAREQEDGLTFEVLKQQFKFRAELLDVSVPRHDSIETAEQWAHVRGHIVDDRGGVPLPDGSYFLDEYILMFREVLDRNSSSVHKLTKRYQRACLIAEAYVLENSGAIVPRAQALAERYPVFGALLDGQRPAAPANLLVLTRVFEQLVDSHKLNIDLKLLRDSALLVGLHAQQFRDFLTQGLSAAGFEMLMKTYATLGAQIYNRALVLAGLRNLDKNISEARSRIVDSVADVLTRGRVVWARMDEFVIHEQPRVPEQVKLELARDAMQIVVYPESPDRAKELGQALQSEVPHSVLYGDTLFIRLPQRSEAAAESPNPEATEALAVVAKVQFIITDPTNRIVPRYPQDLDALVKAYRRSLPAYSEYYALSQKKRILKGLENAMATFL